MTAEAVAVLLLLTAVGFIVAAIIKRIMGQ